MANWIRTVVAVASDSEHRFSKSVKSEIELAKGLGVVGDAHAGVTVQHLSRIKADPSQPNLRQVHLMSTELFDELAEHGFSVSPGELGENVTTQGIDLINLPLDTVLYIGRTVQLRVTGLRNPCQQIENHKPGLLAQLITKLPDDTLERKSGIMCVVEQGGWVRPNDIVHVHLPPEPHIKLEVV